MSFVVFTNNCSSSYFRGKI